MCPAARFSVLTYLFSTGELVDPAVLLSDYGGDVKDEFAVDSYLDLDANLS